MIARQLAIRGRVQGVGFRYAMVEAAAAIGVAGWVRNLRDGTVKALVQGEASTIDAIIVWCQRGPPAARVDTVDVAAVDADPALVGFAHRPTG